MNDDETYSPKPDLPHENQSDSSLDELLDTVRDHLGDAPVDDVEIPLLTEVVMAAPPQTTPFIDTGLTEETVDLSPAPLIEDSAPSPDTEIANESEADPHDAFPIDENASNPDLAQDPLNTEIVDQAPSWADNNSDDWPGQNDEERWPADTAIGDDFLHDAKRVELDDDNDDEAFDVTQVASFSELSDGDSPELEPTLAHSPPDWLERMDQLIDERCYALAADLKMQLRQSMETTSNPQDSNSAG
jgi:hypothetical protein